MSLVDYASSSDDDTPDLVEEPKLPKDNQPTSAPPLTQTKSVSPSEQKPEKVLLTSPPSMEKLPDASLLINSPALSSNILNASDHSSRVAAALAENASRKRDANRLASSTLRSKVPRGNVPPSRNVPDTAGGMLVPPQISGRRNVVTEDIGKLFVKKQNDPSSSH